MELLLKNSPNHYETGDAVVVMPDGWGWGEGELNTNVFTIEKGVTLTDSEAGLLTQQDIAPLNNSAISRLPTFRSLSTKFENAKLLHNRKYAYDNGSIALKPNAQER